jgi:hypothetical protein
MRHVLHVSARMLASVETIRSVHESGFPGHCSACILSTVLFPIYAAGLVENKFAMASLDGR